MFRKTKCLHIQDVYRKVSHKEKEWEEKKRENKYKRIDNLHISNFTTASISTPIESSETASSEEKRKMNVHSFIYCIYNTVCRRYTSEEPCSSLP